MVGIYFFVMFSLMARLQVPNCGVVGYYFDVCGGSEKY